jgi:cupin fold WbuC family metalloprotein
MKKIFSNIDPKKLISTIISIEDINSYRTDVSPDSEFLQVSARRLDNDIFVKAHRHKYVVRETNITQEAWIVHRGKIKAMIYDIDKNFLEEIIISDGGCIVLYNGGHSLTSMEENTIFYEIKNGPYFGYENDKEDI